MSKKLIFIIISAVLIGTFAFQSLGIDQESSPSPQPQGGTYKTFTFRVKWDGRTIPGITSVGGLVRQTAVVKGRGGGDPSQLRKSPGLTAYEPIVLKRPRTHDKSFEQWANKVWNFGSGLGVEVSLKDFRKDITIELYNESGQLYMSFRIYRCWPSEYTALSDLDSEKNSAAFESITLEYEGFERDYAVVEPSGM